MQFIKVRNLWSEEKIAFAITKTAGFSALE